MAATHNKIFFGEKTLKLVSVILPIYNGERYLKEAIESCLNQTYENIEIVVVDDASTDKSLEIIRSYQDPRIKIFFHAENLGIAAATNTGYENAKGDYFTRFAADDIYVNTAVQEIVDYFEENLESDVVFTNQYWLIEPSREIIEIRTGPAKDVLEYNSLGLCVFFKKKVYQTIGPVNGAVCLAEDYEYWLRCFLKVRIAHLDKFFYYYRLHPESLTGRFSPSGEVQRVSLRVARNLLLPQLWKYGRSLCYGHMRGAAFFKKIKKEKEAYLTSLQAIFFYPQCLMTKQWWRLLRDILR